MSMLPCLLSVAPLQGRPILEAASLTPLKAITDHYELCDYWYTGTELSDNLLHLVQRGAAAAAYSIHYIPSCFSPRSHSDTSLTVFAESWTVSNLSSSSFFLFLKIFFTFIATSIFRAME